MNNVIERENYHTAPLSDKTREEPEPVRSYSAAISYIVVCYTIYWNL